MSKLPGGVIFIVDPKKEEIAVREANMLNIPIIAMVDTNCDPDVIDYVIPANDDAIRAIMLITSKMADAVIESKEGRIDTQEETETEETSEVLDEHIVEKLKAEEKYEKFIEEIEEEEEIEIPDEDEDRF